MVFIFTNSLTRPIWKKMLRSASSQIETAATTTAATNSSSSSRNISAGQKRLEIRVGIIMSVTVLEFFIFQLPIAAVGLSTISQRLQGKLTMPTEPASICTMLKLFDCIINPLWTTFLSKAKNSQRSTESTVKPKKDRSLAAAGGGGAAAAAG